MDELKLIKYFSGELDDIDNKEVELWLEVPENKIEFDRLSQLWNSASNLKEAELFQADKSWADMKNRMAAHQKKNVRERNLSILKYAVAASVLVVLGLASFFYIQGSLTRNLIQHTAGNTRMDKPVTLPDGTVVYLNRNTNLSYSKNFNEETRTVNLTGEAYFDVAKNPSKPFIIRTAAAEIKVVGTSFNVMAYSMSDSVQVAVESGIVEFYAKSDKEEKVRLTVGNEGTFVKSNRKLVSASSFDVNTLAWKTRKLQFRNADMNYVATELKHAFGKDIQFNPENFKNCRLTVNFNNQSLDTILKVIKETFGVKITNNGDVYMLSGPGC